MNSDNNLVVNINTNEIDIKKNLKEIIDETDEIIKTGLNKETASTGTPMNKLSGGAKFMATVSNIGGGSKETGGGGVAEGLTTLFNNSNAKGALKGVEITEKIIVAEILPSSEYMLLEEK